jgi:hypothetical protein
MSSPLHAFYVRSDQHTPDSIRQSLVDLHFDDIWLRIAPVEQITWDGSSPIQVELYHLREGMPMLPEAAAALLSSRERVVLRLSVDATRTTVAYEVYRNGVSRTGWAGDVETFEAAEDRKPKEQRPAAELRRCREAFLRAFGQETGVDLEALLASEAASQLGSDEAIEGTEALVRGRFVKLMRGMGRWPEMFRFHDRNETDDDGISGAQEHVALVALDLRHAERLWKRTPARQAYQFLRAIEPLKRAVLGPLAHALPDVLAAIETHPPEAPLAASAAPDLTAYEVLAASTALVFMVGDRVRYLDERFFPALALSEAPISKAALEDSLDDVACLGVLSAMTEVLPYSVPEGQMMEAFADEEVSPLATWAVADDMYEGTVFLLDPARLRKIVDDFDIDALKEKVTAFRTAWSEIAEVTDASADELAERGARDEAELSRFEDTFVELQHVLRIADLNDLSLALIFYSE